MIPAPETDGNQWAGMGRDTRWDGMRDAGCGMRDAGCGMRDAGCGMRDAGCGMRDAGCGMRDAGCGMRDAGCGMRDAGCGMRDYGLVSGRKMKVDPRPLTSGANAMTEEVPSPLAQDSDYDGAWKEALRKFLVTAAMPSRCGNCSD